MIEEQADVFAEFFRQIANGAFRLALHCAVGKDRTVFAAAPLLDLLGVPLATIEEFARRYSIVRSDTRTHIGLLSALLDGIREQLLI